MHRFYCPKENIYKNQIIVDDKKEAHHILNVMRLGLNDRLAIFDGEGNEFTGSIEKIEKDRLSVKIDKSKKAISKKVQVTLACAMPKQERFDYIIEKTTELGIAKIIPLKTERTIVNFDKKRLESKIEHWRNIAIAAAKQCGNNYLPQIEKIKTFSEVLSDIGDYDLMIIPCLIGKRKSLKQLLTNLKPKRILVLIGPEGDFTDDEIRLAIKKGCKPVSLGENVLRVDTAAIFVSSILNYLF